MWSCWGHVAIILGSVWDQFGISLGSYSGQFGIILAPFWYQRFHQNVAEQISAPESRSQAISWGKIRRISSSTRSDWSWATKRGWRQGAKLLGYAYVCMLASVNAGHARANAIQEDHPALIAQSLYQQGRFRPCRFNTLAEKYSKPWAMAHGP